jgi:aspartate kinase
MKFGGTSVKDAPAVARLIGHVARARLGHRHEPRPTVVLVSALSGVTDALLTLTQDAVAGRERQAHAAVAGLRDRHAEMLGALVRDHARREAALARLHRDLDEIDAIIHALAVLGEASPRSRDVLAATGELVSSRLVATALEDAALPSVWIDARRVMVTTADHGAAVPLLDATRAALEADVAPRLAQHLVPVMGGFIGATAAGVTTTLGRGGSDYSASIVGAALGADEIQIWTDVDGMLTADPRLVPGSRLVPELSFDEASELAYFGAKVLHPSTILPAMQRGIPVRILNATRPDGAGTRIAAAIGGSRDTLAAIACKRDVSRISITSTRMLMAWGFLSRVFSVFERFQTPVDVVTTSEVAVSVTIDDRRRLDEIVEALGQFADVDVRNDMAIVSAVGERLRSDPTLGTRMLGALEGLPLEMVSQGGTRKNLTVVVADEHVVAAMTRWHERFFVPGPGAPPGDLP